MGIFRRIFLAPALRAVSKALAPSDAGDQLLPLYMEGLSVMRRHLLRLLGDDSEAMLCALVGVMVEYVEESGQSGLTASWLTELALGSRGLTPEVPLPYLISRIVTHAEAKGLDGLDVLESTRQALISEGLLPVDFEDVGVA